MFKSLFNMPGRGLAFFVFGLVVWAGSAGAVTPVQRVISPGGIEAWLMEGHEAELITLKLSFEGGAVQEPADRLGVANLVAYYFNEGAGEMDSAELTRKRQRIGVEYYAKANMTNILVTFSTPSLHRQAGFEMLELAIKKPRFDTEPMSRALSEAESEFTAALKNPSSIAADWINLQHNGKSRYALNEKGTLESLPRLTREDVQEFRRRTFTRSNLRIGVAGDITASELAPLLDKLFSELPAGTAFEPPSALRPQTSKADLVRMDLSQTLVMFGNQVPRLSWRQGLAFDVANQVLSGSFTGRLFREVREKRGLVYTIATARYDVADSSVFFGSFGAGGDNAGPALEVTRSEIARFAAEGPTEEEVRAAKDTFLGGYLLGLDTNDNLATTLIAMQRQNMPITLLSDFESEVERLTREDVHAAVKQLIRPDLMATIAVGNPPEGFKVEGN